MRSLLPLGGVIVAGLLLAGCGSGQNSGPAAGSPVADPAPAVSIGTPIILGLTASGLPAAPSGVVTVQVMALGLGGRNPTYSWIVSPGWTLVKGGATAIATFQAPSGHAGNGSATVTVTGPANQVALGTLALTTILDPAPTLTALTVSPSPAPLGGKLNLTATATGAPGDVLSYAWTLPTGWAIASGQGTPVLTVTAPNRFPASGMVTLTVSNPTGGSTSGQIPVTTASAPAPVLGSLVPSPNPGPVAGTITIIANASGAPGDILTYAWTTPPDWPISSGQGTGQIKVTAPNVHGSAGQVMVAVSNGKGGMVLGLATVSTVSDPAPVLGSLTASPNPAPPGAAMTLSAAATGAPGDTLAYAWTVPGGWTLTSGQGTGTVQVTAPQAYSASGTVGVTVTNPGGVPVNGTIPVGTQGDSLPTLSSVLASPSPAPPGTTVTLAAIASGVAGDSLSYIWVLPGGWTLLSGQGTANATALAPNAYTVAGQVILTVGNGHGGSAAGSVTVSTAADPLPTLSAITASPNPAPLGGTATLTASAGGSPGDSLSYTWVLPGGWTILGGQNTPSLTVQAPAASGAAGSVLLTVANGHGGAVDGMIALSTVGDALPSVTALSAAPNPVAKGGSQIVSVSATGAPGDTLSYAWSVTAPWTISSGQGSDAIAVAAPDLYGATGVATVIVTNPGGSAVEGQIPLATLSDPPPAVASVTASPNPAPPGATVNLSAQAAGLAGDTLTYTWALPNGWTLTSGQGSATATATATSGYGATGLVTVTVRNGAGASVPGSVPVSTLVGSLPTVSAVTASANPVALGGVTTLTVAALAAPGDSLSYAWALPPDWSITQGQGSASVTVQAPVTASAGVVVITVGNGHGGTVTGQIDLSTASAGATGEALPAITALTVTPNPTALGSTQTLTATATGNPGDTLSYAWIVPSGWTVQSGQNTGTLTVTAPPTWATTGQVTVTVGNGGGTVSGVVPVATGPDPLPVVTKLVIDNPDVLPGGQQTLTATATGAAADTLGYAWTVPAGWQINAGQGTAILTVTAPTATATPAGYAAGGDIVLTVSNPGGGSVQAMVQVGLFNIPVTLEMTPTSQASYLLGSSQDGFDLYGTAVELVTVLAYDANHVPILGPGAPTINVFCSQPAGTPAVTVTGPSSGNPNGFGLQVATFDTSATLTAYIQSPSYMAATIPVRTHHRLIWVADVGATVDEFYDDLTTPARSFSLANNGIGGFAAAKDGTFFLNLFGFDKSSFGPVLDPAKDSAFVFQNDAANPTYTISGPSAYGLIGGTFDPEDNLLLVAQDIGIMRFPAGQTTPSTTYNYSNASPLACAVDPDGSLWVIDMLTNQVIHFPIDPATDQPSLTPSSPWTITDEADMNAVSITLDRAGTLYIGVEARSSNTLPPAVQVYPKGATSAAFSITTEAGGPYPKVPLANPSSIAMDAAGRLWVGSANGHLRYYPPPLSADSQAVDLGYPYSKSRNIVGITVFPQ